MNAETPPKTFRMLAERLCLDFTNTVGGHGSENPYEHLENYGDVLLWCQQAGALGTGDVNDLLEKSARYGDIALETYQQALDIRALIFRIFSSIANEQQPQGDDLNRLNTWLEMFPPRLHILPLEQRFMCDWVADKTNLSGFLGPILWSAATLLASDEVKWVKQCGGADCGWLFLDTTKNHTRRWCDMADCGSRAKAKRYYDRKRQK